MNKRLLIIGGYGNFGRYISKTLAKEANVQLIIAGRSIKKAKILAEELNALNPVQAAALDINDNISADLEAIRPDIVIHTSGPFQLQNYNVAKACVVQGCHYIDLADGREFVVGIRALDNQAKQKNLLLVSGASSVPAFTSALVDEYRGEFDKLESLDYGISTAQKTTRGLATTSAILSYTGKPFHTLINGRQSAVFGWQGLHTRNYKKLGKRLLGYCDVPDLALFPQRYPELKKILFYAGLEIPFIHVTLWALSWGVRAGIINNLQALAPLLLRISFWFDWLGSNNSAFHMVLTGKGKSSMNKSLTFELTAGSGDGPYIPCMPSILIAKKLVNNELDTSGAYPCIGLITLSEYLDALSDLDISWEVTSTC